eukprot:173850_1
MISLKVIFINCLLVQFNLKNWIIFDILFIKSYLQQYWHSLYPDYGSYDTTSLKITWIKLIVTREILKLFFTHHKILFRNICNIYNGYCVAALKIIQKIPFADNYGG